MSYIKLDLKNSKPFIKTHLDESLLHKAYNDLVNKEGLGNDFLGWVDLPSNTSNELLDDITNTANMIRSKSNILVVIGIGGSYLGAKSCIEYLNKYFNNDDFKVIFAGHQLSSTYLVELKEYLKDKDFYINVISKSGTTTEPAIAFRELKQLLIDKHNKDYSKYIIATTDEKKGALKELSDKEGYKTYIVPDNVGGRYSVLTPVGLLPIAAAGYNIKDIIKGAKDSREDNLKKDSQAFEYAKNRNELLLSGYNTEMLINYEQKLSSLSEWWKQLFGESEGKENKGIFVASATFSTDLHSLGQYIQEGQRFLFETNIIIDKPECDLKINKTEDNLDNLNYLSGKTVDYVNKQAHKGTLNAHIDGGVPNNIITVPEINEYSYGYLVYFFMVSCAYSGYMLGVNPFDQPGVEFYKKNMFKLLKKPGY